MRNRFVTIRKTLMGPGGRRSPHRYLLTALLIGVMVSLGLATSTVVVSDAAAELSCAAGSYLSAGSCVPADPGYFVDTAGATSESVCPVGTYQPASGATSCLAADPGYFVATEGSAPQMACPVGKYQPNSGQTSCLVAPAGSYVSTPGASSATFCPAGTYQDQTGQTSCLPAPVNTYVNTTGATAPTPRAVGYYQPLAGQTHCIEQTAMTITISSPVIGTVVPAPYNTTLLAPFTDTSSTGPHTCSIDWGDNSGITAVPVTASDPSVCSAVHSYAGAGVYNIEVTITNQAGISDGTSAMVVVYDPPAGFVTGGGWIDSPAGAYAADSTMTGKATFGFVAKYKKGQSVPDGNTQFQFKAGNLNFHSTSYQWLVVNQGDNNAQFKGTGTINGTGNYTFMIWATQAVNGNPASFRIQITDNSGATVYDNGAKQPIGGGSIVIHS